MSAFQSFVNLTAHRAKRWCLCSYRITCAALVCMLFSAAAYSAAVISGPTSSTTGNYTLTWSGGSTTTVFLENNISVAGGSSAGSYVATGKAAGTYAYRLDSYCSTGTGLALCGTTSYQVVVSSPQPLAPASVTANGSGHFIQVSWSSVSPITHYNLKRDSGTPFQVNSNSYLDSTVSLGASYVYSVQACNGAANCSGWTAAPTVTAPAPPNPPSSVTGSATNLGVTLSWVAPAGATSYYIRRVHNSEAPNENYGSVGNTTAFTDNGVVVGDTYDYSVKSCDATGWCSAAWSQAYSVRIPSAVPITPASIAVNTSGPAINVSWSTVSPITHYNLKRDAGAPFKVIPNSYSDATVTAGTNYTFSVQACNGDANCSGWIASSVIQALTPPSLPTSLTGSVTGNEVTITWVPSAGATTYYIRRVHNTDAPNESYGSVTNITTFKDTNIIAGHTYAYSIKPCNANGFCSPGWTSDFSTTAPYPPTAATAALDGTTGVPTISWTAASGATRYEIQQGFGGAWGASTSTAGVALALGAVSVAGTYSYQVRACTVLSTYTNCSAWVASNAVSIAIPAAAPVVTLVATSTTGTYSVSWLTVVNANRYIVNESINGAVGADFAAQTTLNYSPATAKANASYGYQVKACNAVGCGALSALKKVDVAVIGAHGAVTASMAQITGVPSLNWAAVAGATRYEIQPKLGGVNTGAVINVTTNSATLAAVTAAGSYTYAVKACAVVGANTNCGAAVTL